MIEQELSHYGIWTHSLEIELKNSRHLFPLRGFGFRSEAELIEWGKLFIPDILPKVQRITIQSERQLQKHARWEHIEKVLPVTVEFWRTKKTRRRRSRRLP